MEHPVRVVYVFIDVANVWSAQKSIKKLLDYSKLKQVVADVFQEKLNEQIEVKRVFYYEAYPEKGTREYDTDGSHKFMTFLKKGLGFCVRKKPIKQIKSGEGDQTFIQEKGNMDVEISIDALHFKEDYDIAVFFTGDSDFFALTKYLMCREKQCYIFSSRNNVSQELRTGTNGYFDIIPIESFWGEDLKYRNSKK